MRPLHLLITTACLAVIFAAGWLVFDHRATQAADADRAEFLREADLGWQRAECRAILRDFDAGDTARAEAKFGADTDGGVAACRGLVRVDEVRQSKPSE